MNVINMIALLCAIAGCSVVVAGFVLSLRQREQETEIRDKASESRAKLQHAKAILDKTPERQGAGYALEVQSTPSTLGEATESLKELIELTRSLRIHTPALKAFTVATAIFLLAGVLAIAGRVIS